MNDVEPAKTEASEKPSGGKERKIRIKRKKASGAYYYVTADQKEIAKYSLMRNMLSAGAFLLQAVMLLAFRCSGRAFISVNYPSVAYLYACAVFVALFTSLYVCIMNFTLYKLDKRIPKERAPKKGFSKRVFLGTELFIAANAMMTVFELAFVCVSYDGWSVAATLVSALATAAAVIARQASHVILRQTEFIPAPDDAEKSDEAKK